jgi:cytochrome b6-f complex iron-sulfur subunit
MNRRDVIHKVAMGGTVLFLVPSVFESCTKDASTNPSPNIVDNSSKINLDLTLAANSTLNNTGGWLIVQNIIVINTGNNNFTALSSVCTHQGCTVGYNSGSGNIQCPCHGSVFSTDGNVVSGPAQTSLKTYKASLAGNTLTISL